MAQTNSWDALDLPGGAVRPAPQPPPPPSPTVRPSALQPTPPKTPPPSPSASGNSAAAVVLPQVHVSKPKPAQPSHEDEPEDGEDAGGPLYSLVRDAPAFLTSSVVHMILLILMGLWMQAESNPDDIELTIFTAEEGEQLIDESPVTILPSESLEIDTPVFSPSNLPAVDLPMAAPPSLTLDSQGTFTALPDMAAFTIGHAMVGRETGNKVALLAKFGGTKGTENAVSLGLGWLARHQQRDGSWSLSTGYLDAGQGENRPAATAMALLAFQGAGHTHLKGEYKAQVAKGWDALLKMQSADGNFWQKSNVSPHSSLYTHAQATIAVCELYGMTKDSKFRNPAERAIAYCVKTQTSAGGWRYTPGEDADLSVSGWFSMGLQSAMMAGLPVPKETLDNLSKFLDACQAPGKYPGSRYKYHPGSYVNLAMTAEGLLCRQYLGWRRGHPALNDGAEYLLDNPIDMATHDVYYWYYATQVLHHLGGEPWEKWNNVMREVLPKTQVQNGAEKGSWDPGGDAWGSQAGRLYVTCLSIYMLEVYYRHLPIYSSVHDKDSAAQGGTADDVEEEEFE